jgi:hypothetical protein
MEEDNTVPAWFYGPNGQAKIFDDLKDVPAGWQDHPSKVGAAKGEKQEKPAVDQISTVEIDADGHTFDPALHTGTKTKAGLWRMKVGVTRPAPVTAGAPLDL